MTQAGILPESPDGAAELAFIATAMVEALDEAQRRLVDGDQSKDFRDLVQHIRELVELFSEALDKAVASPDAEGARTRLAAFSARLVTLERDIVGAPLH